MFSAYKKSVMTGLKKVIKKLSYIKEVILCNINLKI